MSLFTHADYSRELSDMRAKMSAAIGEYPNDHPLRQFFRVGKVFQDLEKEWEGRKDFLELLLGDLWEEWMQSLPKSHFPVPGPTEIRKLAAAYECVDHPILQWAARKISLKYHLNLLKKVKTPGDLPMYLEWAMKSCWSNKKLEQNVDSRLHERMGNIISNFEQCLPQGKILVTHNCFINPVCFNLSLPEGLTGEKELTDLFMRNVDPFISDIGQGFSYWRGQPRLNGNIPDFLLFNMDLKCLVVVEFKMERFRAEFVETMNNYLKDADRIRDQSIGLILCTDLDQDKALNALKRSGKPIGIATFLINGEPPGIWIRKKGPDPATG